MKMAIDGGSKVRGLIFLTEEQPFSWVVRKNNPQLAAAINSFFKKENKSAFFNLCKKRYYSARNAQTIAPWSLRGKDIVISEFDPLFRKYGDMYGFDWYLLAAQSYQESHFDPGRINHIGATGLMQVLPKTAQEIGVSNLTTPDNGIHAGAKYMAKLRDCFDGVDEITPENQLCFSLASYNAGYGHVMDARALAAQLGLDPNVWFGNTEKALALLEDPKYASQAKYGYCRASETIPYVSNIIQQKNAYEKVIKADAEAQADKKSSSRKK